MKKLLQIVILSIFTVAVAKAGGPWTQKKGQGYYKLSEWWLTYNKHYTVSGELDPNITTGIFNTSLYVEHGITDRFTTIIYAPIFSRNYFNNQVSATTGQIQIPGEALNSIGDFDLSLKYALTTPGSKIPVSVSLTLGFPTGKTGKGSLENLQTGDGEFNQMLQVHTGTGFQIGNTSAYTAIYVGVNNRTNSFSDEFRYGFELGFGLFNQKLWLTGRINGVESFRNGGETPPILNTGIFANNAEYLSYGFEAAYYLTKRIGISASFQSAFQGKIIAAAPSYSFGIFYDLSK